MNVVHLSVNGPYTDGWGYQENIIPKYHKKMGHDVTIITNNMMHSANDGSIVKTNTGQYFSDDGVRIIRLERKKFINPRYTAAFGNYAIYSLLCELKPDYIMVHGLCNISSLQVAKYVKRVNKDCKVVADNHQDYYNTKTTGGISAKFYRYFLVLINSYMQKVYKRVYCVTPDCMELAHKYYKISKSKTELLPLGFDTDSVDFSNKESIRAGIRDLYNINSEDLMIVTGGKIEEKKNTHILMNAINNMEQEKIKLIVFGNFMSEEYQRILRDLEKQSSGRIKCIGMLSVKEIYNLYLAADVAIFPGTQSALWQQAVGTGLAVFVKRWPNIEYLDLGGNMKFLENINEDEIRTEITNIINDKKLLKRMKAVASTKGVDYFSYEKISKSIL